MHKSEFVAFKLTKHDAKTLRERAKAAGQSISEYCRERVFEFKETAIPAIEMPDGQILKVGELEKGRVVFVGPEYEETTEKGRRFLTLYRAQWDEKRRVLSRTPVHDETSHGADALRYYATSRVAQLSRAWDQPLKYNDQGII